MPSSSCWLIGRGWGTGWRWTGVCHDAAGRLSAESGWRYRTCELAGPHSATHSRSQDLERRGLLRRRGRPGKRRAPGACNVSNSGIRVSAHRRSREVLFFHDEMQANARWTGFQAGPRRGGPLCRLGCAHALAASGSMSIPPSTTTTASGGSRYAQPLRVARASRPPIRPRTRCRCVFQE